MHFRLILLLVHSLSHRTKSKVLKYFFYLTSVSREHIA
jgi:hypothetical protein